MVTNRPIPMGRFGTGPHQFDAALVTEEGKPPYVQIAYPHPVRLDVVGVQHLARFLTDLLYVRVP